MRRRRIAVTFAVAATIGVVSGDAAAHDFEPGVLVLEQLGAGDRGVRFHMVWSEPVDGQGQRSGVTMAFPPGCARSGDQLECEGELKGWLRFDGLHESRTQVLVIVRWQDGTSLEQLVTGDRPQVAIEPGPGRDVGRWLRLGLEHIALGYDHIAFVLGLLLVAGLRRRVIATVTAFTAAHSISLALAATGTVRLGARAVEAVIALSVVLVAREALHDRPTLTRARPYLVAFGFGLVHGLGFASALSDVGLPREGRAFALAFFNLGVELGQLLVVALAAGAAWLSTKLLRDSAKPRLVVAYAIGSLGAAFLFARVVAIARG